MRTDMPSTTPPLLVDAREAARLLAISPRTLWSLSKTGEIPVVRLGKRAVRYDPEALRRRVAEWQEGGGP